MRGGVLAVWLVLGFAVSSTWSGAPSAVPGTPAPNDAIVIRVDNGTSVTIWERTTDLNVLTYPVTTLTGPGGTFDSIASEHYTFTSEGIYLKIHCYRNAYNTGATTGNNIAAARLDGVPGYPGGLYASIIVSYIMGYGGLEALRFNALGTNLSDITYMGDQESEIVLGFTVDVTSNRAPVIHAISADAVDEGQAMRVRVNASDADGDALVYDYDFDGDGTFELTGGGPEADHTFGDDFAGTARVRVRDAEASAEATTNVLVRNVAPTVDADQPFAIADVTLRVAGEKWHDVRMDLVRDNQLAASMGVTRYPGSPDRQGATISGAQLPLLGAFAITIRFTPVQAHAFATGTYTITMRVTDDDGGVATASWTLTF